MSATACADELTDKDKITFSDTFNAAILDILLLVGLLGVFLLGAFLVFIRSEV